MWKKIVFSLFLVISAAIGFLAAKAQVTLFSTFNQAHRDYENKLADVDLGDIEVNSDKNIVNILVVGNDFREESGYSASGLTDTMIIATMDKKHGALKTASLMRDCCVEIPGYGYNKLNSANSFGKIELLYKTIAQNFNIRLDGYVEIDFNSFVDVVDAVGGVKVTLTESEAEYLNTTNFIRKKQYRNVKVGEQTLNGHQALGYCRIRKKGTTVNGLRDDYGRTWRQRTVINAVFDKVKKMPKTKWLSVANKVMKNIKTDLTNEEILSYLVDVLTMGTTKIHQLQIPLEGYYRTVYNGEFPKLGSCLVMTDGVSTEYNVMENANALNEYIFSYNGKNSFKYGSFESKEE